MKIYKKIFLLVGIFLLFGIFFPMINAEESTVCCKKSGNALCVDALESECDSSGFFTTSCNLAEPCLKGYCYQGVGLCASESPKGDCISNAGQWSETKPSACEEGCCKKYRNTEWLSSKQCQIASENEGFDYDWDDTISEKNCIFLSLDEGACEYAENSCEYTTEKDCFENYQGIFRDDLFCSVVNSNYTAKDSYGCVAGKTDVYWLDSYGNKEEIKESCDYPKKICETRGDEGYCKYQGCRDENNQERNNGDQWCEYDSYVGEGKDTVGSEHWLVSCVNGEISYEGSEYRNKVCAEKEEGVAQLRPNQWKRCFGIETSEECNNAPDCKMLEVDLRRTEDYCEILDSSEKYGCLSNIEGDNFYFDICVLKYPKGFDIYSEDSKKNGKGICSKATQTCNRVERQGLLWGSWECKYNCDCSEKKFVEQMNEFCVSLGDCGGYVNSNGTYTTNFKLSGGPFTRPDLSNTYTKFSKITSEMKFPIYLTSFLTSFKTEGGLIDKIDVALEENKGGFWRGMVGSKYRTKTLTYTCESWGPPIGGEDCSKCNEDPLKKCTDYRCKSLGKSCGILPETKDKETPICYSFDDLQDPTSPIISFGSIGPGSYLKKELMVPKTTFKMTKFSQCIGEFKKINFSIKTDEVASCKWDYNRGMKFEEMNNKFYIGNEAYSKEHFTNEFLIVGKDNLEIYIKCQDPGTNENEYSIDFCINPQPDMAFEGIRNFEPASESYLKFNETNKSFIVNIKEQATCKYSKIKNNLYENMVPLLCNVGEENSLGKCEGTITNLTLPENKIYFRCNDTSGNINMPSNDKEYILLQTPAELKIDSFSPQGGTLKVSKIDLDVKTSGGINNGKAICSYEILNYSSKVAMFNTDSFTHKQAGINLAEGKNKIEISCKDKVGNMAIENIEINVEIDTTAPKVVRAFHSNGKLNLFTNEKSQCFYNFDNLKKCNFNFENATKMSSVFSLSHTANWFEGRTYYIKCNDLWDNSNTGCAIKVTSEY